ncbi:MAG: hypothetical protein A2499_17485 [Stygiobacter sp. RIFOXYC12_FULL_38_8]|nr:MAG: hypothetical protein A2X62_08745 [Stygiobacter sp. GWC2_38_9]OGU78125.1 MAG: hypothetical protein A2279_04970 [Stygiobacter sp. RIFOXYA12_FULL_38_9]OGV06799.1 MAG: hypothetical protein A2299_05300 [Stygiobacter sp. RIFOXYB2_FULL_37_11]OGV12325.1 MAG: hypothetical protein A2440_13765 [Stygiobacter sp. RIFOXYC2_FULL_38_25]OGV14634.1 MAG: hypothetical protein A2237_04345 [Stygiobacter sp. RIFOXYA2_FULL_38_8]OGV25194.1 MAG: hypothetical protein A2499_17485 [Stygiobacter sp. RIFOXYC12_FULL_
MEIRISYKLKEHLEIKSLLLTPEEYFDPIEANESFEDNGVPRFNSTYEYIGLTAKELKWAIIKITCDKGISYLRSQYLDGDRSMMEHTIDYDGSEVIIHSNEIEKDKWHIIKIHKTLNSSWRVIMNVLIDDKPNSESDSKNYIVEMSKEDLFEFSKN